MGRHRNLHKEDKSRKLSRKKSFSNFGGFKKMGVLKYKCSCGNVVMLQPINKDNLLPSYYECKGKCLWHGEITVFMGESIVNSQTLKECNDEKETDVPKRM